MNKIIEKLYAEELGVTTVKPVVVMLKRIKPMQVIEYVWGKQSRATRTTIISLFFILVTGFIYYYNQFIAESFDVHLETAQMEAELYRKNILITELAKVVKDYMTFEGRVFVHAADVRSALEPFKEQIADAAHPMDMKSFTRFKSAISKFQAVTENYPVLKASETYQKLMLELANTETRMTSARAKYNSAVNRYNTSLTLVPGCVFGYIYGFKRAQTFVADKSN